MRLVIATSNPDKVNEIARILAGLDVELITLSSWSGVPLPDETGRTFDENARLKALYYAATTGELVVAEDSGLEIDALGGAPGVESARYGGRNSPYTRRFELIHEAVRARGLDRASARFVCALAVAQHGDIAFEARGTVVGRIAKAPAGAGGFGYDPIFFFPPYARTFAQVTREEKEAVSHRGRAFRALRWYLERALA